MPQPFGLSPPHSSGGMNRWDPNTLVPPEPPFNGARRNSSPDVEKSPTASRGSRRPKKSCLGETVGFRTVLRVRPPLEWETELARTDGLDPNRPAVDLMPDGEVWLVEPACLARQSKIRFKAKRKVEAAVFDTVIWSYPSADVYHQEAALPYSGQAELFEAVSQHPGNVSAVDRLFAGVNQCVLACGAACSGKTFSMLGTNQDEGLLKRFLDTVVSRASLEELPSSPGALQEAESIRDSIGIRESTKEGARAVKRVSVTVEAVRHFREQQEDVGGGDVNTLADVERVVRKLQKARPISDRPEPDRHNRSVLVIRVRVSQEVNFGDVSLSRRSWLSLVDLGGGGGRAPGETPQEAKLSSMAPQAVSRVFAALADRGAGGAGAWSSEVRVPYRESALTQALQDELGGNCQTVVVCCVSPCHRSYLDTTVTMDLARKAHAACGRPQTNESRRLAEIEGRVREHREVQSHIIEASADVDAVRKELRDMRETLQHLKARQDALALRKRARHANVTAETHRHDSILRELHATQATRRAELPPLEQCLRELRQSINACRREAQEERARADELQPEVEARRTVLRGLAEEAGRLEILCGRPPATDSPPPPADFSAASRAVRCSLDRSAEAATARQALGENAEACAREAAVVMERCAEASRATERLRREAAKIQQDTSAGCADYMASLSADLRAAVDAVEEGSSDVPGSAEFVEGLRGELKSLLDPVPSPLPPWASPGDMGLASPSSNQSDDYELPEHGALRRHSTLQPFLELSIAAFKERRMLCRLESQFRGRVFSSPEVHSTGVRSAKQLAETLNALGRGTARVAEVRRDVEVARRYKTDLTGEVKGVRDEVAGLEGLRDAREKLLQLERESLRQREEEARQQARVEQERRIAAEDKLRQEEAARKEAEAKLVEFQEKRKKTGCCVTQ
eukprot:Hpha_TRINITY_DN714_c0_g1::TRINITY_DN714_c0_g1_i1::g.29048::m.29048